MIRTDSDLESGVDTPQPPVRVLHCVGHLIRGGVEMGLFNILRSQTSGRFEHHILVRTAEEEPFTDGFRKAGVRVLSCPRYRNPVHYALDFRRLVRDNGPYDILHVHGSSFSGLLTLALAKLCGIGSTIVHSHNDVRPDLKQRGPLYGLYVTLVLSAYRALADSGFAASVRAAESMFGANWKDDSRWELLYYGIDCRAFAVPKDPGLRRSLGIPDSALVLGHVGRFHEQKNHAFLLDVVQAAVALNEEVVCLLIGDGALRPSFTAEVRRKGLERHFVFVPDTLSVSSYMISAMDCFLFPSKYEGLGLVVLEAQAAGLPCLISDRIPSEAIVDSSTVKVLPLEDSPRTWAVSALRLASLSASDRSASLGLVESSRFNLAACANTLFGRYLELAHKQTISLG